jgi:hypothetical protein
MFFFCSGETDTPSPHKPAISGRAMIRATGQGVRLGSGLRSTTPRQRPCNVVEAGEVVLEHCGEQPGRLPARSIFMGFDRRQPGVTGLFRGCPRSDAPNDVQHSKGSLRARPHCGGGRRDGTWETSHRKAARASSRALISSSIFPSDHGPHQAARLGYFLSDLTEGSWRADPCACPPRGDRRQKKTDATRVRTWCEPKPNTKIRLSAAL